MDYKEFFSFTQQERRGIIVFLVLAVVIIFGVELYSDFDQYPPEDISRYYLPEDSISLLEEGRDDYSYKNDLCNDSYQKTPIFYRFYFVTIGSRLNYTYFIMIIS